MEDLDMDKETVKRIIGDNRRFSNPFDEPCGYYICAENGITDSDINLYWDKLKHISENVEEIIRQAFKTEYFNFCGVDKSKVLTPEIMCDNLIIESFVLFSDDKTEKSIGSCLSNGQFMFGHYIELRWDKNWQLLYSDIC